MHSLGPAGIPVPVTVGPVHRRVGQRAPLLRDGVRRGPHPAQRARGRGGVRRGDTARRRATTWPTRWPRCTTSTPTRSGSATWVATRGTSSASSSAGAGSTNRCRSKGSTTAGWSSGSSDELARRIPKQQRTSVVHGDYRMDNVVLADDGSVRAILDWEICTLGRPARRPRAADGLLGRPDRRPWPCSGSRRPRRRGSRPGPRSWSATARSSDLDLSEVGYYTAFGYWKLGCILQGVYARYVAGAGAGDQGSVDALPGPGRAALRDGGASRWSRCREPGGHGLTEIFEVHREPVLHEPGAGGRARGLGRRRAGRDDRDRRAARPGPRPSRWSPSTASTSSTSGPGGRWPASSTA